MAERRSAGRLKDKVALVTGASQGIGLAIAHALAAEGCDLVITSRNPNNLKKANRKVAERGVRVLAQACDVSDAQSVEALFAAVKKEFGRLDVLINNAGISHAMAPVEKLGADVWGKVLATNLTGMFLVTRASLPLMGNGSTIVNNLSVAAKGTFAGESAYCASKHGALGLTNTLREEVRPKGIRVIALMPGPTDTEIWNQFWPDAPREKMMSPETVAVALVSALVLPANSTVEELTVMPTAGEL
ncbi:MAG TPA: SDR family oxidoreductase [Terriglobales bacterium]|nr:SDR family oxidoreductase [Terriglobales bacterium]